LEEKGDRSRPVAVEPGTDGPTTINRLPHELDLLPAGADHRAFRELTNTTSASDATSAQTDDGARQTDSRRDWLAAQRENRCVFVSDDAMAPIVADGASVVYSKDEEDALQLDGKLVVAWLDNQPVVRWFQQCGRYALLRAQNPATVPQQVLVDLEDSKHKPRFRRVLWVNTPH
jgi:hypothetical protein